MTARKLNKQVVVRVDDDLYAALQRDADEHGRTVSQSLRFYARRGMEKAERPSVCPTCGSRAPMYAVSGSECDPLSGGGGSPDPWHGGQ